jgi:hypothetical protein
VEPGEQLGLKVWNLETNWFFKVWNLEKNSILNVEPGENNYGSERINAPAISFLRKFN